MGTCNLKQSWNLVWQKSSLDRGYVEKNNFQVYFAVQN